MNMPTLCPLCDEVVELDEMKNLGSELYCTECYEEMESGSNE